MDNIKAFITGLKISTGLMGGLLKESFVLLKRFLKFGKFIGRFFLMAGIFLIKIIFLFTFRVT
jgi:hypothetical protein